MAEDTRLTQAKAFANLDLPQSAQTRVRKAQAIIRDLLTYADERLKVNVGLIEENKALKKASGEKAKKALDAILCEIELAPNFSGTEVNEFIQEIFVIARKGLEDGD